MFGALVAVLALLLSLAFGELLRQRIQRDAGTSLHAVAGNAAHLLAAGLFDNSRLVQVLAGSPDLWARGLDAPEVIALLQRSQALRSHQVWIGVADAAGIVRASSGNLLRGHDVKERPWFQAGLQDLYVGDVHPAKLLSDLLSARPPGEPLRFMDFAAPIRVGPQTVGVLGIHVGWDWARETVEGLLSPFAAQQQIALFVFDRQGELIYAPAGQLEAFRAQGQTLPWPPSTLMPTARTTTPRRSWPGRTARTTSRPSPACSPRMPQATWAGRSWRASPCRRPSPRPATPPRWPWVWAWQ
ncbi:cache domain-containing protein [Paenacidovorax monticola]|uniref:cache domain-containing protein n=1 Tax=Paenacidovorax monticola TaxID=1926868 RepID=UPI001FE2CC62|nr:cache domain-containing protein [Paenacidovorax monticola]